MIPSDKTASVARGLSEAFGTTAISEIEQITRGLSSDLVFRIVVSGQPYLLRIMTHLDERNDPVRIFACMEAAAKAGLAPRIHYASVADGIVILDWIERRPFPRERALSELPAALRRLHALPAFPKAFHYDTAHRFFVWRFRTASGLPPEELEEVYGAYDRLCAVYPRVAADLVSSHMDLKPENILFDGARVWLIDWMAAFGNDRYFDLAVAASFCVRSEDDERRYLRHYFGHEAEEEQRARFFLMTQVVHLLGAAVFVLLGAGGKPVTRGEERRSFGEFQEGIWDERVELKDAGTRMEYGWAHWDRLRENLRLPRFEESLRLVEKPGDRLLPAWDDGARRTT